MECLYGNNDNWREWNFMENAGSFWGFSFSKKKKKEK